MTTSKSRSVLREEEMLVRADSSRPPGPKDDQLIGLALSGGGIRAATFHLGILQALSSADIFKRIDYVSSVSGGSYISGWLCKCLAHSRTGGPALHEILHRKPYKKESNEIHRLRQHSSFLAPRMGILGKDAWLFVATYVHNLLANQLVIGTVFAILVLAPRIILDFLKYLLEHSELISYAACGGYALAAFASGGIFAEFYDRYRPKGPFRAAWVLIPAGLGSFLWSLSDATYHRELLVGCGFGVALAVVMQAFTREEPSDKDLRARFLYPAMVSALLISFVFFVEALCSSPRPFVSSFDQLLMQWESRELVSNLLHWIPLVILGGFFLYCCLLIWQVARSRKAKASLMVLAGMAASIVSYQLYWPGSIIRDSFDWRIQWTADSLRWITVGISLAIFFCCCLMVRQSFLRTMAEKVNPMARALLGWITLTGMIWAFTYYMGYRSESIVRLLAGRIKAAGEHQTFFETFSLVVPIFIAVGNAVVNILVALLGRVVPHDARERLSSVSGRLYRYALAWIAVGTVTFYGPLLVYSGNDTWRFVLAVTWLSAALTSFLPKRLSQRVTWLPTGGRILVEHVAPYAFLIGMAIGVSFLVSRYFFNIGSSISYWDDVYNKSLHPVNLVALAVLAGLATVLSLRLGINLSSMHNFYQGRLAQAFLGEALPGRGKQVHLHQLIGGGGAEALCRPYPLFNAAINLGDASDLARQERRAANFIFSPLYCGYTLGDDSDGGAFQKSAAYSYAGQEGIRLAQAMTISGAAIGAGMGYLTSARGRFVHSILNLRLGWWFSNPAISLSWTSDVPRSRLSLWLKEISSKTSDRGPFIYLSDGGHFENLGVYELVRRKCGLIIASDASEDPKGHCGALGLAIERCRMDFGVAIDIRAPQDGEAEPFSIGAIDYGAEVPKGIFVYLKPMMTGKEPFDLKSYKSAQTEFPHHPTRNQWFGESEFESYRTLGEHVGKEFVERTLNSQRDEMSREVAALRQLFPTRRADSSGV